MLGTITKKFLRKLSTRIQSKNIFFKIFLFILAVIFKFHREAKEYNRLFFV